MLIGAFLLFCFFKGNIALFKPTTQSNILHITYHALSSNKAVDGIRDVNDVSSCAHTHTGTDPWWIVDLGREEPVAEVRILNRGDCCADRLDGAEIRAGK